MQYSIPLTPYNDFWMNCILNSHYTIASQLEPSYKYASYMNDYSYKTWGAAIDYSFMTPTIEVLDYSTNWDKYILSKVIVKEEPIFFKDMDHFVEELKHIILEKKQLVKIHVDLFYWLPKNIAWEKFHMSHYSIINGYDPETNMYAVLDDDIEGYRTHEVPEERLIRAFMNSTAVTTPANGEPHAFTYQFNDEIEPYQLSIRDVRRNAERLVEELAQFSFDGLWDIKAAADQFDDYISISLIGINIIENRHLGNNFLIQSLVEIGQIDEALGKEMSRANKRIQQGWKAIKQIFINKTLSDDKQLNLNLIHAKGKELLEMEKEMWSLTLVAAK
ncbi:hypothetical protein [Paenibacillus assamensis]|uniref:hypothetical protein n=1 Tax=Paenibacillus assamensis TaxID=311244 RepID=UPI0004022F57|nr:hypothetical protein [Paenibacillus assamensis]